MKRWLFALSVGLPVGALTALSCSTENPVTPGGGTGGSSTGSGGSASTGGNSSTGGGSATGGSNDTGGSSAGTGGTPATGGSAGAGTGGSATGTGGAPGTGGAAPEAGPGTGGTPGTGGAPVEAGPAPLPDIPTLFPPPAALGPLDGRLFVVPCNEENAAGSDCASAGAFFRGATIACVNNALNVIQTYPVGGTVGTRYEVTMHFYGIVEPKNYGNMVTRDAPNRPGNQDNGASPTPFATGPGGTVVPLSDYNTYEIHVDDQNMTEVQVYFLNADTTEGHWTYVLNYAHALTVVGGGRLRIRSFDSNCRQIRNCGSSTAATGANGQCTAAANARIIDISMANPAPPVGAAPNGLLQPNLIAGRTAAAGGQWLLIDVVSVNRTLP